MDQSIIEVLKVIAQYSGRATWYPLARKTKHNIRGLLKHLESECYITSEDRVIKENKLETFYSITELGLEIINENKEEEVIK